MNFACLSRNKWTNPCVLRRSIHRSIFRYLQKTWNAVMTNHCEWLEKNDNQMALCSVNMAGEVRLPNSCRVYIFYTGFLLHVDENCHGAKLICHDHLAYFGRFISMLDSVSSFVVYNEQLWSFHPVSETHGIPYRLDRTKYTASPF